MAICRVCKKTIDKKNDEWVMPSRNYYFHKKCYEDWKKSTPDEDGAWIEFIYDFISRDLKVSYDYYKCEAQRKKFLKDDMTNKGIFFALKYYYDVKRGDWKKGYEGIGIVPYIYRESCEYWAEQEYKNKGILRRIQEQMEEAAARNVRSVQKKNDKVKYKVDLSAIADMEDDD